MINAREANRLTELNIVKVNTEAIENCILNAINEGQNFIWIRDPIKHEALESLVKNEYTIEKDGRHTRISW